MKRWATTATPAIAERKVPSFVGEARNIESTREDRTWPRSTATGSSAVNARRGRDECAREPSLYAHSAAIRGWADGLISSGFDATTDWGRRERPLPGMLPGGSVHAAREPRRAFPRTGGRTGTMSTEANSLSKKSHRRARANRVRAPRARDALRVSLVMYPHATGEVQGTLARDVELAKAAVLYADHVDLISAQAHTLQQLASVQDGSLAALAGLITDLDDRTLESLGMDTSELTPEIRDLLPTLMQALEVPQLRAMLPPEMQQVYESLAAPLGEFREVVSRIGAESGASELKGAIAAGLLRVVELSGAGNLVASAVDAAAGTTSGAESFGGLALSWADELVRLLQDPTQRIILDPEAISLVQSMADAGLISIPPGVAERSRAAHLGAGFIGRLPVFPDAPFDELLDLRTELSGPLVRYRGAVVHMSKSLQSSPFERAIVEEADDVWVETVAPALADLEDALTEHGLVREMARRARADARALVLGGPSFLIGLQEIGHLSAAVSALVSGGSLAAGVVGPAMNDRRASASANKRAELYYLYRLGQVER